MPAWRKVVTSGSDASLSSLIVTDGGITGSLLGTASYAVTASYIDPTLIFPYTGSAIITGSLQVIGTLTNGDGTPVASGDWSHAEGLQTISSGSYSHAEGSGTITDGLYSHAEGQDTLTIGTYSHAEGNLTIAGWRAFTISSVSAGLITISDNIDYSSEFTSGIVILDNIQYGYNAIAFNSPDFTIQLDNIDVNGGTYVADIDILNSPLATNILGTGAHSTGTGTKALGNYSETGGDSTTASGYAAHAEGASTQAIGDASHAEGVNTRAEGPWTHAEGTGNIASGDAAHAEGKESIAHGYYSHAEGQQTTAYGQSSHAEGLQTISSGSYSHAEGYGTTTIGNAAHAEGSSTIAVGDYSHAEGNDTQTGWRGFGVSSVVAGLITINDNIDYSVEFPGNKVLLDNIIYSYNAIAFSSPSFTIQLDNITINAGTYVADLTNLNSTANYATTLGSYSHAEGENTLASGYAAHAEGVSTLALGNYSHAEGDSTQAIGYAAHAEGVNSVASGDNSHAEGNGTIAASDFSHVSGLYNITSSVVGAFIVGNGVDDATRSNLLFAGDSTVQITGSLQVTGGITGSVYGTPFLRNKTNPSATDTITINQSIFNPANLTVLSTSIFIIEADADYYVLGDLINSGSIVVDGTLKVGGVLYNAGTITGTGIIE